MTHQFPRLHAITNDEVLSLPDFLERARRITDAPGTAVHIRSGTLSGRMLTRIAAAVQKAAHKGMVFVNDRADVARIVGAAGLHLPSTGLSTADARSIVGPACWIGRSAHSRDEVIRAGDDGADYVFLGPIWATASHPNAQPLGPKVLSMESSIPIIAIGGITQDRVTQCLDHGALGVAVISTLWGASDIGSAVRALSLSFPA